MPIRLFSLMALTCILSSTSIVHAGEAIEMASRGVISDDPVKEGRWLVLYTDGTESELAYATIHKNPSAQTDDADSWIKVAPESLGTKRPLVFFRNSNFQPGKIETGSIRPLYYERDDFPDDVAPSLPEGHFGAPRVIGISNPNWAASVRFQPPTQTKKSCDLSIAEHSYEPAESTENRNWNKGPETIFATELPDHVAGPDQGENIFFACLASTYADVPNAPTLVWAGDINRDGKPDLLFETLDQAMMQYLFVSDPEKRKPFLLPPLETYLPHC